MGSGSRQRQFGDDAQIAHAGTVGCMALLLPIAHGIDIQIEAQRKLLLRQPKRFTDAADIDRLALRYTGIPFRNRNGKRVSAWVRVERWEHWE